MNLDVLKDYHLGAWPHDQGVSFRVWAQDCKSIDVVIDKESLIVPLKAEAQGYFYGFIPALPTGSLYKFRINGEAQYPDPCSRFQPEGPHGPSLITDPHQFKWQDQEWQRKGIDLEGQVIYENWICYLGTIDLVTIVEDLLK